MNGQLAKKLRKLARRNFMQFYLELCKWPFHHRLRFCWALMRKRAP